MEQDIFNELFVATNTHFDNLVFQLPQFAVATFTMVIFWLFARLQKLTTDRILLSLDDPDKKTVTVLVGRISRAIILIVGAVLALSIVGVDWSALATALGLVGFGVSFALRDYIENFLAGLIILTQKPFKIGDQIQAQDKRGKVEEITIRYTIIKDFDGRQVIIPNAEMLSGTITRDNAYGRTRYSIDIDMDIYTDLKKAAKQGILILQKTVGVLTRPKPRVVATKIEGGRIRLTFYFWANPKEEYDLSIRSHAYQNLLKFFYQNKIDLGYDTQRVITSKYNPKQLDSAKGKNRDDETDDAPDSVDPDPSDAIDIIDG